MFGRLLTAAAATLMVAAVQMPADATISTHQRFTVPANGRFTVVGHGYGHGHGMSQYGANGAAKKGLSAAQILSFYYPGTKRTQITGRIRVLIGADTGNDVVVRATRGRQWVRDFGADASYDLPTDLGATRWRITVDGTTTVVGYFRGGAWHRWRSLAGDGGFRSDAGSNALVLPDGSTRDYRGTLVAASPTRHATTRRTVNLLPLDDYVKGVVPAEMPASWESAAVQAQAIAARTYAAWQRQSPQASYYDICDSSACQVYAGMAGEAKAANTAVTRTAGTVLTYRGKPAFTQFSASSGGWTSAGGQPYLPHRRDPYDDYAGNPVHDWRMAVNEATLERAYPAIGDLRTITVTKREGGGQWGGRVVSVTLHGARGDRVIAGDDLRWTLGLRSTWVNFRA